jgi:hypothetical protein
MNGDYAQNQVTPPPQQPPIPFERRKQLMISGIALASSVVDEYPDLTGLELNILVTAFSNALPVGRW